MYHPEDENVRAFDAIDNDVSPHGKAARADAEILVARASDEGKAGQKREAPVIESISRVATSMLALSLAT